MSSTRFATLCVLALLPIAATRPPAPTTAEQSVRQVATLHAARAVHTATTLASGDILIVGGMTAGGGATSAAELFDPRDNSIRDVGSLATPRHGHTATLLPDGRVLIAGGFNGDYLASLEIYDPSTNRLRSAGSLTEARSGHTATLLPDGRILFAGGVGRGWTFLKSAELLDPATGHAEPVGSMTVARESHTATLLEDGRVLIVGGHAGRHQDMVVYSSSELFSPKTRQFVSAASLRTARHKHDAVKLPDGRVLVVGGADRTDRVYFATTEIYDPRAGTFEAGPRMANERYKIAGTTVALPDGSVLVTSGARTAEVLDVARERFRGVSGGLAAAFRFAAAAPLRNGDVLIVGGYTDANQVSTGVWRFEYR
jgi:WD40 repeat protein